MATETREMAVHDEPRALTTADPEQAATAGPRERSTIAVTVLCEWCEHPFVALVWYATQRKAYCSDMCRDGSREAQRRPIADRFWEKVNKNGPVPEHRPDLGPCWLWTGSLTNGYGYLYSGGRTANGHNLPTPAYRVSYEINVGPVPGGLTIDHLCRVTQCVNPTHLEAVTMAENIRRSEGVSALHGRSTHCQRGHVKSARNTYRYPDGRTECAPCRALRGADFRAKRKAS